MRPRQFVGVQNLRRFVGVQNLSRICAEDDRRSSDGQRRLAASHYYLSTLARLKGRPIQERAHLAKTLLHAVRRMPERVLAEPALAVATGGKSSKPPGGC